MNKLTAKEFENLLLAGWESLTANMEYINGLNVFPVPDGDTGTNMSGTLKSGIDKIVGKDFSTAEELSHQFSRGLLMGARGNSGVITSQIFKGFAIGLKGKEVVTTKDIANALISASEVSYAAVMNPTEGTILTVIREMSEVGKEVAEKNEDFISFLKELNKIGYESLDRTPDLLPVLKEAGVVDSGGMGLMKIFDGFLAHLNGEEFEVSVLDTDSINIDYEFDDDHSGIENGYCTQFVLEVNEDDFKHFSYEEYTNELSKIGDSIAVVADEGIVNTHVHTETPGIAINMAQDLGESVNIISFKIENMREEAKEMGQSQKKSKVKTAIIAVAMGEGLQRFFREQGVHVIIDGGQSMNPSAQDFLEAMQKVEAETYLLLPNNSNIVLSATQAADIADEKVLVIPTKTIPQGLVAVEAFSEIADGETQYSEIVELITEVTTGELTKSVRNTTIGGVETKEGDYLAIANKKIMASSTDFEKTVTGLFNGLAEDIDPELVTLVLGKDASKDENDLIKKLASEIFEDADITVIYGEQDIYPLIIGVE